MSVMDQVQIIPSSLHSGKRETVVVIFPVELPRDVLITLDLAYDRESSSKRSKWSSWVPAQPLGPNSVQAKLPELPHPGQLEVLVKAAREIFSPFPKFRVRVQSPVEAIFHNLSLSPNDTTALACVSAYLLQNTEKDRDTLSHVDVILCNILRSQPSLSDWNMSSIICGKYGQDENLLHLCIRQKLEGAASYLLQNIKGREVFLQQRDYKGKTPSEIARKKGEKRIADMLDKAMKEYSEGPPTPGPGGKLKKSQSLEYEYIHSVQAMPGEEDVGPLPLEVKGHTGKNLKHMFNKIKKKSKKSKGPVPVVYPSNMPPPESEFPTSDGPPLPPRSPIATRPYSVGQEPAIIEKRGSTAEPLEQLLSRCIYTASVLVDYHWDSSPFGDQFSLKRGDKVYVIKEIGDDLCQGICKNFYCMVPKNILGIDTAEGSDSEDYENMSPEDDYDMVDDTYEYPEVLPFPDTSTQPPPHHNEPLKGQSFRLPPMKAAIKQQPNPIPGRLLPNCTLSSSHDSGLDRLGMPRQVSKGKLHGPVASKLSGGIGQTKQHGVFPPGHTTSRASYEWKSLKATSNRSTGHRPMSEISPPGVDDEYDDAATIQQIAAVGPVVQQQNKDRHTSSASPQPRARHPATRAGSVGSSSQVKAHMPVPKPRVTTSPSKSEPPLLQDSTITSQRKERQTARATSGTAAAKGPPKVADLMRRFENK